MIKGYARVSTDGQTLDAQQAALQAAGAERVFAEKQSGVKTDRAALARCMASLESGDTVLVTKLDGSPDQLAICSTLSTRSAKPVRASSRWVILGRIPRPHMAS